MRSVRLVCAPTTPHAVLTVSCALGQATFSMTFVTRGFFRATIGKAKPTSEPDCVLTTRVTGPGESCSMWSASCLRALRDVA